MGVLSPWLILFEATRPSVSTASRFQPETIIFLTNSILANSRTKFFPASGVKSAVKTKSHGESAIHCPEEVFIQSVGSAQNVSESAGTFVNASCSEAYRRISEARSKRLSNAAAASGQAAKSPDASS